MLLCTYRAVGWKYWKYTLDGTNVILINLMGIVLFVILDYWLLKVTLDLDFALTHPAFIFTLALFSIIPLAYFIGQAVASISAQSSMGLGAAINAFFSTVVEVFLYCVALDQGKGKLVEGSIIGSIFAGILFLPGLSMCFGAIKRKTQRFNAKSAGVTSTMLLFAVLAAFGPTLFYQIYGTHELNCLSCSETDTNSPSAECRKCYFSQEPAVNDRFFVTAVRPYTWFAAVLLFMSYIIGLWFTLRTHAAVIWASEADEKKATGPAGSQVGGSAQGSHPNVSGSGYSDHRAPNGSAAPGPPAQGSLTRQNTAASAEIRGRASVRDSQLYKRILGQSLRQAGLVSRSTDSSRAGSVSSPGAPYMVPPRSGGGDGHGQSSQVRIPGLSAEENENLVREVAEMAATAATVAARDAARAPRKTSLSAYISAQSQKAGPHRSGVSADFNEDLVTAEALSHGGGHDAPNWSRTKSSIILLGATILYAVIAEILVNTVDVVLESVDIEEKFLGITLFALVPNTTEFLVSAYHVLHDVRADCAPLECHLVCDERQHRVVHGDRIGVRIAGVPLADTGPRAVQRRARAGHRPWRSHRSHLHVSDDIADGTTPRADSCHQDDLLAVRCGHGDPVHLPAELHVRRGQEQLLQRQHPDPQLSRRHRGLLLQRLHRHAPGRLESLRPLGRYEDANLQDRGAIEERRSVVIRHLIP